MKRLLLILFFYSTLFSCKKPYLVSNFEERTASHKLVAILPVEMIFAGNKPKNMTPEMETEIMNAESQAFQQSLFNEILKKSNIKGGYRIDFQPIDKTNSLLNQNNISIRDAWTRDPQQLAEILGVDAVVKTRIQKNRYMSDLASYGIEVGRDILNVLLNPSDELIINPAGKNNTANSNNNDIKATYFLVDGASGAMLWNTSEQRQTDWNYPANVAIDGINSQCAKKFPYRLKP
jgi:hypothetical protein